VNITLVDDEQDILVSLSRFLGSLGHRVFTFTNTRKALEDLESNGSQLVLSDINMPGMNGFDLLFEIQRREELKHVTVVLVTGYGEIRGAVKAMREGAYDYLIKPIDMNELMILVNRIAEHKRLYREHEILQNSFQQQVDSRTREVRLQYQRLRESLAEQIGVGDIGVYSDSMRKVFDLAERLHDDPSVPVLIEGETGAGKEVVAKFIHYGSELSPRPFVDINCAAIAPGLFESELFGYESGAYTGARREGEPGKISLAEGGTLFLDEIGELTRDQQAKLLRLIQERQYYPVGGTGKRSTSARIICATNKPLVENASGDFRLDFYYRLQVGHIRIPPLRERREEIVPLAHYFLRHLRRDHPASFHGISNDAQKILLEHDWPGNVRELKNTIERIMLLYHDDTIESKHLFSVMKVSIDGRDRPVCIPEDIPMPEDSFLLDAAVLAFVSRALRRHAGNKSKTARYLGIPRNRLYNYLAKIDERKALMPENRTPE